MAVENDVTYEVGNCQITVERVFDTSKSVEEVIEQLLISKK